MPPRIFSLRSEVTIPKPLADVFPFFANARNLERITPPFMKFEVLTPGPIEMRRGTLIDYRLKVRGIPLRWQSEITAWDPPHRFVDEQRRGPYRLWRHEHRFEEQGGQTRATDSVEYAVLGGGIVNFLFVRRDVEKIFAYRELAMRQIFSGGAPG